MTEDEAKTKWCPMGRKADKTVSFNRSFYGEPSRASYCLGSDCMMWRETLAIGKTDKTHGYCGLAK